MTYAKDTRKNNLIADYRGTFGRVDSVAVSLINSCKYIYKDGTGEYVYDAELAGPYGFIEFKRRNLTNPK